MSVKDNSWIVCSDCVINIHQVRENYCSGTIYYQRKNTFSHLIDLNDFEVWDCYEDLSEHVLQVLSEYKKSRILAIELDYPSEVE